CAAVTGWRASLRIWMISNSREALRISSSHMATDRTLSVAMPYTAPDPMEKQAARPFRAMRPRWATDMTYGENLWLFFTLLFGIIIVPGMDMIFVLANSLSRGRPAGMAATAGIMAGGAVHSLYGALGVGLL